MRKSASRITPKPVAATRPGKKRAERVLTGAPLQRIWHVHARLSREETVNAETLARELEVSPLTIKRDLDVMRDRLGMPIAWDAVGRTYYYTRECDTLPLLRIDAREALALALAGRVMDRAHGSAFGRMLGTMLKKIAPVFGGAVSVAVDSVERALSRPLAEADYELDHFFTLLEAILGRNEVRLDYAKARSAKAEKRIVHPLHLSELDDRWVLVAFDPARHGVRNFVLARIRAVYATGRLFEAPSGFDAHAYLRGSLGRFIGDKEREVRIALDAHAAFYAREKPWHSSQELTEISDGRIEIKLRLNHLADVKSRVLSWGQHAEVLAPAELRSQIRDELQATSAHYLAP